MLKRLIQRPAAQAALAALLGGYLALVYRTTRWTLLGEAHLLQALAEGGIVAAFWHERLPLMPALWRRARQQAAALAARRGHVLVSRHRDGRFIGAVMRRYGLDLVHASSSQGGAVGLRTMLRVLAAGDVVVLTPDGPRGPARQAAAGVALLAGAARVPVLPCGAATSRMRCLRRSWDRMRLPLPFGRGVLVFGPPVPVHRLAPQAALPAIEAALTAACDAADAGLVAHR